MNVRLAVSALRPLGGQLAVRVLGVTACQDCTVRVNAPALVVSQQRFYPTGHTGVGVSGPVGFTGTRVFKTKEHPHPARRYTAVEVGELVMEAIKAWDRFPSGEDGKPKEVTMSTHFVNDLGLDSLDHVEIIMCIEDQFGLEVPDTDAEKLLTPQAIYEYICDRENVTE